MITLQLPVVQHFFGIDENRRRNFCKFERNASKVDGARILRKSLFQEPVPEKHERLGIYQRNFLFQHLLEENRHLGKNRPIRRLLAKVGDADLPRSNLETFEHPRDHLPDIGIQIAVSILFERCVDNEEKP